MFNKIIVIGCPGSGKSTFSRRLHQITGLPLFYLDMIWHKPDKSHINREEFDYQLQQILTQEKWIIDGNFDRTLEMRIKESELIFLFDFPSSICLEGIHQRIGKKREDMPFIEDKIDEEFTKRVLNFDSYDLPHIYNLLNQYQDKNVIIFKSREEVNDYLNKLQNVRSLTTCLKI